MRKEVVPSTNQLRGSSYLLSLQQLKSWTCYWCQNNSSACSWLQY